MEDVTCVIILVIGFLSLLWKEGVKLCVFVCHFLTSLMMLLQSGTSVCVLVCVCVLGLKCWLPAM